MEQLDKAKQIITEEVQKSGALPVQILLFGSRARGDFCADSDWDFYVVIDTELGLREREAIASRIRFRLAQHDIFADVFVQSENVVNQRKGDTGYLTYYALKEGLVI